MLRQVEKDNSGFAADWKLDSIEVKVAAAPDEKQHLNFAFFGWLSRKAGLQHTLYPAGADELAARRAVTEYQYALPLSAFNDHTLTSLARSSYVSTPPVNDSLHRVLKAQNGSLSVNPE